MNQPIASPELPATRRRQPLAARLVARLASRLARRVIQPLLDRLHAGTLSIELPHGQRLEASGAQPGPHASLSLHRWRPLMRLMTRGDLGLAASYRDGDWSTPDLLALLQLGAANEHAWQDAVAGRRLARWAARLAHLRRRNTRAGSRDNIAFHYDLGNAFYERWLDADLQYSSGIYTRADDTLETAQARKLDRIVEWLQLRPGSRVLEIGCGWGGLALRMAATGAQVTGLTLSTEQLRRARERADRSGLGERIDLRLQDYRDVQGEYDCIVSIEMIEAVGERWWPVYFDVLKKRLRPGGKALLQAITIDEKSFDSYRRGADFIQHFIFPGGMLPTPSALDQQGHRAGLKLQQAERFGLGYASTLAEWRHRFLSQWPAIEPLGFDARFRRLWEYYLAYCEAGFRQGRIDVGLYGFEHAPSLNKD